MSEAGPVAKTSGGILSNFRGALIGGLVGTVATAVVAAIIANATSLGSHVAEFAINQAADSILNRLQVHLKEGGTTNNSDYTAKCDENEIVVGGLCIITSGEGALQNEGTQKDNSYFCTYSRRADPSGVKGKIYAACLGRK